MEFLEGNFKEANSDLFLTIPWRHKFTETILFCLTLSSPKGSFKCCNRISIEIFGLNLTEATSLVERSIDNTSKLEEQFNPFKSLVEFSIYKTSLTGVKGKLKVSLTPS